jgi:hypothetical protein
VTLAASSSNSATESKPDQLAEKQLDFTLGYLNKHHGDLLAQFAKAFSSVGTEAAKKNGWSGGSYVIEKSEIVGIDTEAIELEVTIQKRGESKPTIESVSVELGAFFTLLILKRVNNFLTRGLCMCYAVFSLLQMPIPFRNATECMFRGQ